MCIANCKSYAQLSHLQFTHYSTRDGLSDKRANYVLHDKGGYIWIGTHNGLNRFDGHKFKIYRPRSSDPASIPATEAFPLHHDKEGKIWINTALGLALYDPQINKFEHLIHDTAKANSAPPNVKWILEDSKNRLWMGGSKGWSLYHPQTKSFSHYSYPLNETDLTLKARSLGTETMMEYDEDMFWIASNYGLYNFNAKTGKTERFIFENAKPSTPVANLFTSAFFDKKNRIVWLGSWSGGLVQFDLIKKTFRQFFFDNTPSKISNKNIITDLLPRSENEIWIASIDGGLGVFYKDKSRFEFYKPAPHVANALPVKDVFYLKKDRQQNLWISTANGVYKVSKLNDLFKWKNLSGLRSSDPYHQVISFLKDTVDKKLYMGLNIGDGIFIIDNKNKIQYKVTCKQCNSDSTLPFNTLQIYKDSRNIIWLAGNQGLYRYFPQQQKLVKETGFEALVSEDHYAMRMYEDSEGYLYITSRWNGFYRYHPIKKEVQHFSIKSESPIKLRGNRIADIIEHKKGVLLITGVDIGPYFLDLKNGNTKDIVPASHLSALNSYRETVKDKEGNYWVATFQTGLAKLNPAGDSFILKRFFTDDGHEGGNISHLVIDDESQLWMATQKGLLVLNTKTEETRFYSTAEGLGEEELLQELYLSPDGEMYIGRDKGFIHFIPNTIRVNTVPPPVVLTSFKVLDKEWMDSVNVNFLEKIQLPYNQNLISIEFAALNFIYPDGNQYAYMMEGVDRDWIMSGNTRNISYGGLAPGNYTLKIKAANSDGVWTEQPKILHISILHPFWETWWFYTLIFLFVFSIIYLFHRYRIQQIREKEKLKTELYEQLAQVEMKALRAQMNPHFIFNCLNSINGYIAKNEQKAASHYIARFARLIRQILDNAQHEYISLQNEISTLSLYLEMEAVRFEDKFHYKIEVGEDVLTQSLMIPSMVIQPYVENAIWHGLMQQPGKGFLLISFEQVNDEKIKVVIEDNGIGREKAKVLHSKNVLKNKSYGMKITSDRIKLLNQLNPLSAEQQVIDLYDNEGNANGTKIVLHLPLKQELKDAEI